jgi:hypothetical protein
MDLIARLKGMWRRHDERLLKAGLQARAAGVEGDQLSLAPGEDRMSEAGSLPIVGADRLGAVERGSLLSDDESGKQQGPE